MLYAFANISPNTGGVYLSDIWADTEIRLSGDSRNQTGLNLYGCFEQFYLLKKANRNLKVLLSIGGSSYSSNFAAPASTSSGRSTFASTAVSLVANLGLDGLDINWENIASDAEAANMVLLLQAVREALDTYGNSLSVPYNFTLTVASPAGPSNYQALHLTDMDQYIDFWNLMAYDYAGSWSTLAANQANLFSSGSNAATTPFDTRTAIDHYTSQGIAANKIVLGMPVYGRSFEATEGLGKPFNGVGNGTWEAGVYDFKSLPLSGAIEFNDNTTGSSYSYDCTKAELVSYDTVLVAKQKAAWIQRMGLGGAMWWESSADGMGNNSLILNAVEVLGGVNGSGLRSSPNQLLYPNSTYDNLRAGMPGSSSVRTMLTSTGKTSKACTCVSLSTSGTLAAFLPSREVPTSYVTSGPNSASTPTVATSGTTESTAIAINSESTSSTTGSSFSSEVTSTTMTAVASDKSRQSSTTTTLIVPGKNGVAGCAYVVASELGAGAMCSSDYCNCGGTVAPLLTSSVSGTLTTNCNYGTQPAVNSCPPPVTLATVTEVVVVTCTTLKPAPGSCRVVTTLSS